MITNTAKVVPIIIALFFLALIPDLLCSVKKEDIVKMSDKVKEFEYVKLFEKEK